MKLRRRRHTHIPRMWAYWKRVEAIGFTRVANLDPVVRKLDGALGRFENVRFISSPMRRNGSRHA